MLKKLQDQIMHIIVNDYSINGKNFEYLQKEIHEDLSLIINFISIPESLSYPLESCSKISIKINSISNKEYVSSFFEDQTIKFPVMVCKILNGSNLNDQINPKN